jgi:hypothetical protein
VTITVRQATQADVPWIVGQLREFDKFFGSMRPLFSTEEIVTARFAEFLERHVVFVCERAGELLGFIAGFLTPHFMNPSIKSLTQVFWWVPEIHRRTRAGLMLLKAFVTYGRTHADWITMNIQLHTLIKPRTLERYGFRAQELTYLMEVA